MLKQLPIVGCKPLASLQACVKGSSKALTAVHGPFTCLLPCRKRLAKMISTMRERLSAKLGNNNDNAFKMRKLFKMYDKKEVGMVSSVAQNRPQTMAPACTA
eukprot:GHRQ01039781.1.p1 GENE.GHRQ01039781.1~~GHRQ01039781.1.p1  ORF type:complete len:102 (+),score=27.73 GHRQ01039781.1:291-596(+)